MTDTHNSAKKTSSLKKTTKKKGKVSFFLTVSLIPIIVFYPDQLGRELDEHIFRVGIPRKLRARTTAVPAPH
jgi:hypothetical protein